MPDIGVQNEVDVSVGIVVPRRHVVAMEDSAVEEAVVIGVSSLPCPAQMRVGVRTAVGVIVPRVQFDDSYSPQLGLIQRISPDFERANVLVLLSPAIGVLILVSGLLDSPEDVFLIAVLVGVPPN